jgi:gliding motility-associated-like protein
MGQKFCEFRYIYKTIDANSKIVRWYNPIYLNLMQKLIWLFCLLNLPGFVFGQNDSCYVVTEPKLITYADQTERLVPIVVNGSLYPNSFWVWSASAVFDTSPEIPSIFIKQSSNSFQGVLDLEIIKTKYGTSLFDENFYIHQYIINPDGTKKHCPAPNGIIPSVRIKVFPRVKTYEAITPNDDDLNDYLEIENLDQYLFATVRIFDRWGQLIIERVGFDYYEKIDKSKANKGGNMKAFNGYLNGKTLPSGVYMYSIKPDEDYPEIIGSVTVIR